MAVKKRLSIVILLFIIFSCSYFGLIRFGRFPRAQFPSKVIVINQGHSLHAVEPDFGASYWVDEAEINEKIAVKLAAQLEYCGYKVYLTHPAPGFKGPTLVTADEAHDLTGKVVPAINAINPDLVISIHSNGSGNFLASGYELYWSSYKKYLDDSSDIYGLQGLWYDGSIAYFDPTPCDAALKSMVFAGLLAETFQYGSESIFSVRPNRLYNEGYILPIKTNYSPTMIKSGVLDRLLNKAKEKGLGPELLPRKICLHERNDCLPAQTNAPCVLIETGFVSNESDAAFLQDPMYQSRYAACITSAINRFFLENQ